jgi:hypothetical protein
VPVVDDDGWIILSTSVKPIILTNPCEFATVDAKFNVIVDTDVFVILTCDCVSMNSKVNPNAREFK